MFLPKSGALVANRFRLQHPIGKGGMGQVWEAHDKELDGPCAVKFIVDHLARDPEARLRIVREARAVARLRSPHVVNILSVGEHEDAMYLAMELLEGETLSSRLERAGKLDAATTLALLEQVVQVLDKAHSSGVVHRDLKPDNIWLTAEPKLFVKVLDFGIAKSTQRLGAGATASGALMGTPQYMSPEQANGEREVDHRSDLWALAIIAMECLSGKRPYEASGLGNLLMKIMSSPPPPVHDLDPTLPASLAPWWQRALAHDPNARFQSAADLLQSLRAGLATLPPGPSVFDQTARGNWAEPTPAAQQKPARVRTLVTNISPTPISQPLLLEREQRSPQASAGAQPTPQPGFTQPMSAPRERGTSVGPVTHTAELTRPSRRRRRRWGGYAAGSLALGLVAFAIWRGVFRPRAPTSASDGIDIHWSTLRPLEPSAESDAPPVSPPAADPAPPPIEPAPLPPAVAPSSATPPPDAAPAEAEPARAPSPPAAPASSVASRPSPRHGTHAAAPAPAAAPRPERLTPGSSPLLTLPRPRTSKHSKPTPASPAEDARLKERLGF